MKRLLLFGLSLTLASVLTASSFARYRIRLRDGTEVLATDRPVARGTLLMFHRYPEGVLTSLPEETVVEFQASAGGDALAVLAAKTAEPVRMLQPGDEIDVGETGGGSAAADLTSTSASSVAPTAVPNYGAGVYGGGIYAPRSPNGMPLTAAAVAAQNAAAAGSGSSAVASNGFPATTPGVTTIAPDGTPILTPAGQPGSILPAIASNGTPILAPGLGTASTLAIGSNGAPVMLPGNFAGSATPAIGSNGTPTLAPAGSPGASAPAIGSNGTPILAPAGSPGAAQPVISSNGTPAAPSPHR